MDQVRIGQAFLCGPVYPQEGYEIPEDFRPHEYFKDAWGIWTNGKEIAKTIKPF